MFPHLKSRSQGCWWDFKSLKKDYEKYGKWPIAQAQSRTGLKKAEFGILLPAQGVNLHSPAQRHLVPCSSSPCSKLDSILSFSILYQTKFIMFWQRQLPSLSLQGLLQNFACGYCTVPQLYWNAEVMRSYTWVWIHLLILLCYMLGFFFSNLGEN